MSARRYLRWTVDLLIAMLVILSLIRLLAMPTWDIVTPMIGHPPSDYCGDVTTWFAAQYAAVPTILPPCR